MGSETPSIKLPLIDFSIPGGLKPCTPEWDSVRSQVRQALEEFGCFEASFNKVPLDIRKAVFDALKQLFDLPLQTKVRNVSNKPFHGYVGQYPQVPLFESMGIDDATDSPKVESFTNIFWHQGNPSFRFVTLFLYHKVFDDDTYIYIFQHRVGLVCDQIICCNKRIFVYININYLKA